MTSVDEATGSGQTKVPKELPFEYLKKITNDFSRIIRVEQTGGGTAYEAKLENGEAIIVKRLQEKAPVTVDSGTLKKNLQKITALKHENIVNFFGYCSGEKNIVGSFLCYEYVSNSLHDYLLSAKFRDNDWDKHFKIIEGICQGLLFLQKLDHPIIHMDLKPENILLDDKNAVPKIADFGLAVHFKERQLTMHTENVVGSYGYMAPEYRHQGDISAQSDIYSLGLLIIQIITGEVLRPETEQPSGRKYIDKICEIWTEENIASKYSDLDSYCLQQVKACIKIGLECVEIDPTNRPSIGKIVDKLNERRAS